MKMNITRYCLLCLSLILLSACGANKINPLEYSKTKITFGAGGGFSGAEHSFVLLDNGRIFSLSNMGQEYNSLGRIDKNKTAQVFKTYELFKFGDITLNDPGNMYKYLEFSSASNTHKITWGNNEVDDKLDIMHAILMKQMKSLVEDY